MLRQKCRITLRHLWPSNSAVRNQLQPPLTIPATATATAQLQAPLTILSTYLTNIAEENSEELKN